MRIIRKHDDARASFERTRRVMHHGSDPFVDESHRQLLRQRFRTTLPLVIAHVGIADGQIRWTHNHLRKVVGNLHLHRLERARGDQSVHAVEHCYTPTKAEASLMSCGYVIFMLAGSPNTSDTFSPRNTNTLHASVSSSFSSSDRLSISFLSFKRLND